MDIKEHTSREGLIKYAFMYNEVRLVLASITLLLGKQSPVLLYYSIPLISGIAGIFMNIAWILSGVASGYLLYHWYKSGKKLWGSTDMKDALAFSIAIISGLHLGIAGVLSMNIGMTVIPNGMLGVIMFVAGLLYLWSAFHLFHRFKSDSKIFS